MLHCKRNFAPQHKGTDLFKKLAYQSIIYGSLGKRQDEAEKMKPEDMLRDLCDYSSYWALPSRGARLRAGHAALVVTAMQLEGWPRG